MNLRLASSALTFVGSYLPLSLIFLLQDFEFHFLSSPFCNPFADGLDGCSAPFRNPYFTVSFFGLSILGFGMTLLALRTLSFSTHVEVKEFKAAHTTLIGFALPYVFTFIDMSDWNSSKSTAFGVMFGFFFLMYLKTGWTALNPLLLLFNWRLYEVKYTLSNGKRDWNGLALSRSNLEPCTSYEMGKLADETLVLKPMNDEAQ